MTPAYRSMMGARLREIRRAHHLSLQEVADKVGTSAAYLSQVESGKRALDRHSALLALADALGTSPDVVTALPVPAPGNGGVDSAIEAIRQALLAVGVRRPGGQVVPTETLRGRVAETVRAHQRGDRAGEAGAAIAALIRDLHSSIESGPGSTEPHELAVCCHALATLPWLRLAGAPVDLRLQAATLARRVALDAGTPSALGLAAWGGLSALLNAGFVDLAQAELDTIDVPPTGPESTQVAGMLALCRALVATVDSRPGDAAALFDQATELATHTGEDEALGVGFGPGTVRLWRMECLVDVGDYAPAAHIGSELHPLDHLPPLWQADYWVTYARALARLRGRRDPAARALRRAEQICPPRLYRDPFARDLIVELLARSGDAATPELRGLAQRAGVAGGRGGH